MDIKYWGPKGVSSGSFYVSVSNKKEDAFKVYCDMETDQGGWTLFFNYIHNPGANVSLDASNGCPTTLKESRHANLKDLKFSPNQTKEIRFFCVEKGNGKFNFLNFSTMGDSISRVGMTGNQQGLDRVQFKNTFKALGQPDALGKDPWMDVFPQERASAIDDFGTSATGGFHDNPFGSKQYQAYWTVKGDGKTPVFSCGTHHTPENAETDNASMVKTHHSVWFRGIPPSVKEVRQRIMMRKTK